VLQMVALLFVWSAILDGSGNTFNYSSAELLTYIFGISLLRSVVFTGRTTDVQAEISSGDLNNLLVRPLKYFSYWFSRDIADKLVNSGFAVIEITIIISILNPPLALPASIIHLALFLITIILANVLYFFFSLCISMTTFWLPEGNGWPQRFFILVLIEFLVGGLFPLDILPETLKTLAVMLPTAYMGYAPVQIYLGRFDLSTAAMAAAFSVMWISIFYLLAKIMFKKGTRIYGAYGR
jgi:ABC-2 type transport system permease protein